MSTPKTPFITISQSDSFECVGSDCSDTCCSGWGVSIDKFTLANWQNDPEKVDYAKHLKILPTPTAEELDAAGVILNPNGDCPFLDKQKLCDIQKKHGHETLSFTCRSFPRSKNDFYGIKEENLSLACPTAATLLLGSSKPLELNLKEVEKNAIEILANITPSDDHWGQVPANTAWSLRTLVFKIIQQRKISFSNRLMVLGLLSQTLDRESATEDDLRCQSIINKFDSLIADPNSIESLVGKVPNSFETKLSILTRLLEEIEPFTLANTDYRIYLISLREKLKLDKGCIDETIGQNYLDLNQNLTTNVERDLLLENYCFQLIYKEMYPFSSKSCLDQFLKIALRIFLIREHLKYSLPEDKDGKSESIRLIQKFTRLYEHAPKLREVLKNLLADLNFNTLPHILIILNGD